jgi:hypothetical protein
MPQRRDVLRALAPRRQPIVLQRWSVRFYTFAGGCVTYQFTFAPGTSPLLAIPIDSAVAFMHRARLVDYVKTTEGLSLCGRGAPCPG